MSLDHGAPPLEHRKLPIDKPVLTISAVVVVALCAVGIAVPDQLAKTSGDALSWITTNLGWAFAVSATGFVVLALVLAFGRTGRIRLGRDDERPAFSRASWIAMMFSAGMGIGLMFYGVTEPVTHLMTPPEGGVEPGTPAAADQAMQYTLFHWGLHPWAIYAVVGLALAYSSYRKGRPGGFSAAFAPLLRGPRGRGAAKAIDVLAIFATVFGSAVSLGLGAAQMNGGLSHVFGVASGTGVQITIIVVLTLCFIISAVSGIEKGVKILSNTNMVLAGLLLLFLFVVGPTVFILDMAPNAAGNYLTALPHMSLRTGVFGGQEWLSGWTIFYWAWWMSWTPFVGAFLAKISRGRTIREFVIGVMLIPTLVSLIWFSVFGGTAINAQLTGALDLEGISDQTTQMFNLLALFPWSGFTSLLVVALVAIFFVSGADAASIVMASLSSHGDDEPRRWLTAAWGALTGLVAIVLLQAGGLQALQNLTIIAATPFLVVMVLLCWALLKDLKGDRAPVTGQFPAVPPAAGRRNGAAPQATAPRSVQLPETEKVGVAD
ncbi:choline/carnitine/betaine transport [Quadrisphaera granulorum]|uniref:Choline/carnitine/betaine transport n=1 Tax=Quadrisphaera granulorum TaxID=317664 RepID=A0A316AAT8_9ACTN|nr:BCCT family transporter [Quadrisphaera granulorum]PWJ54120.1 choline/carnitine/betaine transport [Quadrisphaera granulorum]SZE96259.1 choline/carnitine/betaine transport [Quadrisphaera granulorum]